MGQTEVDRINDEGILAMKASGEHALYETVLLCGLLCIAGSFAHARENRSKVALVKARASQATITVKSNLVLVPVFVYDPARITNAPKEELPCVRSTIAAFFKLLATQPYLPTECDVTEVHDLALKDFHVYEGGTEQQIVKMDSAAWWTVARDNLGWYMQSSYTPRGIWESGDLSRFKLVPPGINRDFYILAYVPRNSDRGCHQIRVEVDRPQLVLFARDQYCAGQAPSDPLFGTSLSDELTGQLRSTGSGKIPVSFQADYIYTQKNTARVDVSIQFPWNDLYHAWDLSKWKLYARIAVIGVLRSKDGTIAARFSDLLYPSYWPTFVQGGARFRSWQLGTALLAGRDTEAPGFDAQYDVYDAGTGGEALTLGGQADEISPDYAAFKKLLESSDPAWLPTRYETQVDIPPGEYNLQVIISDESKFGRVEMPLTIEPYDGQELALSSVTLCKRLRDAAVAAKEDAAANFTPQHVPLVSKGIQFIPAGDTSFSKGDPLFAYFELYEPSLAQHPGTTATVDIRVLNASTGQVKEEFAPVNAAPYEQPGSTVLRVARTIPFSQLAKGAYVLQVRASDSPGGSTTWRSAKFRIE